MIAFPYMWIDVLVEPHLVKLLVSSLNMETICLVCTTPSTDPFGLQPGKVPEEHLTWFHHSEEHLALHTEIECDIMYFIVILVG